MTEAMAKTATPTKSPTKTELLANIPAATDLPKTQVHGNASQYSRRRFLQRVSAGAAVTALSGGLLPAADPNDAAWNTAFGRDWSQVHGFNYQPSYGSSGFELCLRVCSGIAPMERRGGTGPADETVTSE